MVLCSVTSSFPLSWTSQKAHPRFRERCCKILRAGRRPNMKLIRPPSTNSKYERLHIQFLDNVCNARTTARCTSYVLSVMGVMITLFGHLRYGQIPMPFARICLASQILSKPASRFTSRLRARQSDEEILRALARQGCMVADAPYQPTWRAHGITGFRPAQPSPSGELALPASPSCFSVQLGPGY